MNAAAESHYVTHGEFRQAVLGITERLESNEHAQESRFDRVESLISRLSEKQSAARSINWGWVTGAIVAIGALVTFTIQAYVTPVATRQTQYEQHVSQITDQRVAIERNSVMWELWLSGHLVRPPVESGPANAWKNTPPRTDP